MQWKYVKNIYNLEGSTLEIQNSSMLEVQNSSATEIQNSSTPKLRWKSKKKKSEKIIDVSKNRQLSEAYLEHLRCSFFQK